MGEIADATKRRFEHYRDLVLSKRMEEAEAYVREESPKDQAFAKIIRVAESMKNTQGVNS